MNSEKGLERIKLIRNFPLKAHTSFKIGGEAKYCFVVSGKKSLKKVISRCGDFYLLGGGSNLLIKDGKINKPIVKLGEGFDYIKRYKDSLCIGAAVSVSQVINYCLKNNLGGWEIFSGLPAKVGGLLFMNASAFGRSISDLLSQVEVMRENGKIEILNREDIIFSYRRSSFKKNIILSASFRLREDNSVSEKIKKILTYRHKRQEIDFFTAGCIFKNPSSDTAGRIIESCGLKGLRKNKAYVSLKHANFIVNSGGATYNDVDYLISTIKEKVYKKYNLILEEELIRWQ